ncbi:MAG TPA: YitT family protein [Ferruginibacter sp.]|nr:YitT family protein [Ferruginibacter sp.]HNA00796.1 YitT family protein [Ferruginibacter sp.]HNA16297.1 YitT family protein [Ferruginibacter sp.]HNF03268.1 YitT family protein [Ferruginibacter sp.]HNG64255.1 YitT family protein [Ferruginibacter sp.]
MTRKYKNDRVDWKLVFSLKNFLHLLAGTGLAVLAMKGFMIPNRFLDGGVTGISILLHELYHVNISLLVILLNLIFIYLGYKKIGKTFAIQTCIAVILLSLGLLFININPITTDKLLIAIFGGLLIGAGVGLVIRGGGVIDGAEVIAVFTRRKVGFSNSEIIMLINCLIFAVAAFKFGLETAMYSVITYFTATRATNYVVDGIEEFTAMNIISSQEDEVKNFLVNELGKGITVYKGERGYLPGSFDIKTDCQIIVTIVTRLEIKQIQDALRDIDPTAFVYVQSIREASGGILKARPHAH